MKSLILCTLLLFCTPLRGGTPADARAESTRRNTMVQSQIIARGITDTATIEAMREVKRHLFVPTKLKKMAYEDGPLPIGYGQTISQPYIVAYMTEYLHLKKSDKVLEIGTGSGYQAAVLAKIVDSVFTIEIIPELGTEAKKRLKKAGYDNVKVKTADGYFGWKAHAPFDKIIVTAAAGYIPEPLIKQLAEGGRMIIPVGNPLMVQYLVLITKENGKTKSERLLPVRFVPFRRKNE